LHARECALAWLFGDGWPARGARLLGFQSGVRVRSLAFDHARPAHPPLRVAFASDLHAGPTTHPKVLGHACAQLASLGADIVLWGGDFVSLDAKHIDQLVALMACVRAPLGSYAVLGNHDLWVDHSYIETRLAYAGIQLLTNRNVRLPAPFDSSWICGIDDHGSGHPDATAAFAGADGVRVVLMHSPASLADIGDERFDLALCGHTHGGQIALPNGAAILVPGGKLGRRYSRGVHHLDEERKLVVSLGVGFSTLPFRAFAPSEVIACTLTGRAQVETELHAPQSSVSAAERRR
jgi:predicted MPP superfamily phosphohydrolase